MSFECIIGESEIVRTSAENYLQIDPILAEAGEVWSSKTLFPVNVSWGIWVHCFHTGTKAKYLITLTNERASNSSAVLLEGSEWDALSIMRAATIIVRNVFPGFGFREQRSILMDIGKASYKVIGQLSHGINWGENAEELVLNITVDPYQPLIDIDWIEERMEEVTL
jgi:hypothetical protein